MKENKQYEEIKENSLFYAEGPQTREMLYELQCVWSVKRIFCLCVLILFSAIFVWNLITKYFDVYVTFIALVVVVLYALLIFWAPRKTAKHQYEAGLVSAGGELRVLSCFTEGGIEDYSYTTGAHVHVDYHRIQKLQKTKHCYFIWLEKRMVLLFSREQLKKGTEAELEAFLIQKCPLAKKKL